MKKHFVIRMALILPLVFFSALAFGKGKPPAPPVAFTEIVDEAGLAVVSRDGLGSFESNIGNRVNFYTESRSLVFDFSAYVGELPPGNTFNNVEIYYDVPLDGSYDVTPLYWSFDVDGYRWQFIYRGVYSPNPVSITHHDIDGDGLTDYAEIEASPENIGTMRRKSLAKRNLAYENVGSGSMPMKLKVWISY